MSSSVDKILFHMDVHVFCIHLGDFPPFCFKVCINNQNSGVSAISLGCSEEDKGNIVSSMENLGTCLGMACITHAYIPMSRAQLQNLKVMPLEIRAFCVLYRKMRQLRANI